MHKIDSFLVHPIYGVCKVLDIETSKISGEDVECYKLECSTENIIVKEPVNKAKSRGIRKIISKNNALELIKTIQEKPSDTENNWKVRCQENTDKLKTGDIVDTINVAKDLFVRNRVKELSASEKRLYEKAYLFIIDELTISLKKDRSEIEDLVVTALEKSAKKFAPDIEEAIAAKSKK